MTRPGELIGRYRVVAELGRDALSTVLHAIDEQLDRPVVVRVIQLAPIFLSDHVKESRQEFRRLARIAAGISHPNLVTVYSFEPLDTSDLIVTEFVEGTTWRDLIDEGERLSAVEAARVGVVLADALATAHDAGLAHGRVSLSNIVRRPDGRPKILDLGMPKLVLGMNSVRAGDPSDDVAALAAALVAMVTGVDPLASAEETGLPGASAQAEALRDEFAAKAEFGIFAPVLRRALRLDGSVGYADGAAFRSALRSALEKDGRRAEVERVAAAKADAPSPPGVPVPTVEHIDPIPVGPESATPRLILPVGFESSDEEEPPPTWHRIAFIALTILVAWIGFTGVRKIVVSPQQSRAPSANTGAPATGGLAAESTGGGSVQPGVLAGTDSAPTSPTGSPPDAPRQQNDAAATPDIGLRTATVSVLPRGTAFRVRGRSGTDEFVDSARLSIAAGDSLIVSASRAGYVAQTRTFRGEPLRLNLTPDSVWIILESNVPANVYRMVNGTEVPFGASGGRVRAATGTFDLLFRAPGYSDWVTSREMDRPGQTYTVAKTDYPAFGSIVISTTGGWANIEIDGRNAGQSPVRLQDLAAGRHVIRVQREGYVTVVDTVELAGGATVRRQYQMRPGGSRH